ncbi:MAG TPA: ABC transporter permease [Vicinamibacterales bacterium]|nr:ABC transporter permease [Vicinamibacterales bacterium]
MAVWLLTRRLGAEWREFVVGDLEEEFFARSSDSPRAARAWFWWQAVRCLVSPPPVNRDLPSAQSSPSPGDSIVQTLIADIRYAFRVLLRAPSFALAVVAVLALGIGANTAIFSMVNSVLLRPLPFEEPDRLVRIFHVPPQDAFPGMPTFAVSPANFYDWKRDARRFERMAIYRFRQFTLTGAGTAESIVAGAVGADFFEIVRVRPALGRVFLPEEDSQARRQVVILSDRFWKSHFGAAPDVVGRSLRLDGEPYTIVGVMPASFSVAAWGATARDLWVPLAYTDDERAVRENHNAQVVARLNAGVDAAQADAEMRVISTRLEKEFPKENAGWGATVVPLHELLVGDVRMSLLVLLAAVALVLLIACANVGNLILARSLARRKELAIRSALGAGRARVFQQLLIEALVLGLIGGAVGLLLAQVSLDAGATLLADQVPRADEISIDGRVLLFVFAASILTGILAGALPALRAGRVDLTDALKEGGRQEGTVGIRTRRLLIVCEVALSLVLLMGAGVMLRSLLALRGVDAGFDPRNVLTMRVTLPETRYKEAAHVSGFFDTALERVRALPGVQAAGAIDDLPFRGGSVQPIVKEGHAELLPRDQPTVEVRKITPGYLRAMGIPLLRGRDFVAGDVESMLVSRSAATLLWGDDDPIGRRVTLPLQSRTVLKQVVGIVGDVKQGELSEAAAPTVYEYSREYSWNSLALVLRTSVPPTSLARPAADIIHKLDPDQPIEELRTMDSVRDETLTSQRFSAVLLGLFAAVALTLASVGIYSVLSYIARGRSREIGIRTALGARTPDVLRLVVLEGMTPTLAGIAAGGVAAFGAARVLERLVFGVSALDPMTLAGAAGTLAAVALLASLLPAYRAARQDPLKALRAE